MRTAPMSDTVGLVANRACRNCVQIKVKCTPLEDAHGKICSRCHRLGKTCTTPAPVPRKQRAKSARVTQLEHRIDQLTALLTPASSATDGTRPTISPIQQSTPRPTPAPSNSFLTSSVETTSQGISHDTHDPSGYTSNWGSGAQPVVRSSSPSLFLPNVPGRKDGSQLLNEEFCPVYIEEALENKLFKEFRNKMLKFFPPVVINPSISNEAFKEQKPFAYWAGVTAASYRDRKLHQKLHEEMFRALGHRMLVAGAKSMDLLQGLLILMAWHHYISHHNPQLMNMLHLAQALLADLGIGRPIRVQDKIRIASDTAGMMHGIENTSVSLGSAERRALLGCYCLTSKASFTFGRIDPMRYSEHINDCCEQLRQAAEYKSDVILVELTQLHRIFGKYQQQNLGTTLPHSLYRTMLQDELQRYRQGLAPPLQGNKVLELEILSASVTLLEPDYGSNSQDNIDRLNALHACVEASNGFARGLLDVMTQDMPHMNMMLTMSLLNALIVLARLSFFKSEGWDTQYARNKVNFRGMLQRIQDVYEAGHRHEAVLYPEYKPWRFAIYAEKAKHVLAWFDAKVAAEEAAASTAGLEENPPNTFNDSLFGGFDDEIWHDMMGNWTNFYPPTNW